MKINGLAAIEVPDNVLFEPLSVLPLVKYNCLILPKINLLTHIHSIHIHSGIIKQYNYSQYS